MIKIIKLSKVMKKIRIDKDISLRKMAFDYGRTPQYISAIENGKANIPADYFAKCCEILNLTQEEKIEVFNAILELQKDYLSDIIDIEQKQLLQKIYELFAKLKNAIAQEISDIVNQIKQMLDRITSDALQMNLFNFNN